MNFGFSEEQELLRSQVQRFMNEACSMEEVRRLSNTESAFSDTLWQQVADLGWLGLTIPESYGGLGLKWIDLTVVLEETARGLSPLPIASQALASLAVQRLASDEQRSQWLPAMAAGQAKCTVAIFDEPNWVHSDAITLRAERTAEGFHIKGTKPFVCDAMAADYLMLAVRTENGLGLAALGAEQVTITAQPLMDKTKPMANVSVDTTLPADYVFDLPESELALLADCGAVAVTAEMVGAAEAALALTSGYAKERIQFGKPIGQYQGVKHRLAEMYVDVESFRSLLYYAAWAVDDAPEELPRAISMAKGYASDAFAQIGIDTVGLHGAIGFTAEYDAQLYLKRSKWARPMYGDSDYHLERVAALGQL